MNNLRGRYAWFHFKRSCQRDLWYLHVDNRSCNCCIVADTVCYAGPVKVVAAKPFDGFGSACMSDVHCASCLVHADDGAIISNMNNEQTYTSLTPRYPQTELASASNPVTAEKVLSSQTTGSRLTVSPKALDADTYLAVHEVTRPPVIGICGTVIPSSSKKLMSKKDKKVARAKEKKQFRGATITSYSLALNGDMNIFETLQSLGDNARMLQCSEPAGTDRTGSCRSFVVSPFTAVVSKQPMVLHQPANLRISHCLRQESASDTTESSVNPPRIKVLCQSLSVGKEGEFLSLMEAVDQKDVEMSDKSFTVTLYNLPVFSVYVAIYEYATDTVSPPPLKVMEFRVMGDQYHSRVMVPLVVASTNGFQSAGETRQLRSEAGEQLVPWGEQPVSVNVRLDEDITVKMAIWEDDWTVKPNRQIIKSAVVKSSQSFAGVQFSITSREAREVGGVCSIELTSTGRSVLLPFYPPALTESTPVKAVSPFGRGSVSGVRNRITHQPALPQVD